MRNLDLRARLRKHGLILAAFMLAAALANYPVLAEPRSRVIGWENGDNIQYVYMTGWVSRALFSGQSPFIDPHLNYPDVLELATTDAPFLSMLLVAPFSAVLGPIFGYNLIQILSSWLSGLVVYLWLVRLTGSRVGGIAGGLAFMLAPYRIAHSYGHLQLISTQFLPLFFWMLDRALLKPGWKQVLALALATLLVGSMSQYYLFIALISGGVYALLTFCFRIRRFPWQSWRLIVGVAAGSIISAAPYLAVWQSGHLQTYNLEDTRFWSASPLEWFVPAIFHPLWGAAIQRAEIHGSEIEHTLYLGIVACSLAIIAIWKSEALARRHYLVWLGVSVIAMICASGTDLHFFGKPVQATDPVWLPMYYLAQIPFLNLMRTWSRFGIVAILFVSLLAGIGAAHIITGAGGRKPLAGLAIIGLLMLDLFPGRIESLAVTERPVDRWIAAQPGEMAVAILPAGHRNYENMLGSLLHRKHLPASNHPTHQPEAFRDYVRRAAAFPDPQSLAALRAMNFRYLILDGSYFTYDNPGEWGPVEAALAGIEELEIVAKEPSFMVLALR